MNSPYFVRLVFMSWNIYSGADLTPLFDAAPEQIPQRVTQIFRQFLATNFPKRAKAIAKQIASKEPNFIGLQEVDLWELLPPNSSIVIYDFVEILLHELRMIGLSYKAVATNRNFSVELPSSLGNSVRLTDRDVILMRKNCDSMVVQKKEANFKTNLQIEIGGQPTAILRGWSSIDARVDGHEFTMVNTHLDPDPAVQMAQANELLQGPGVTDLPLIFTGDFNSNADGSGTQTYQNLLDAGFKDVWSIAGKGSGFTCCQNSDLLNAESLLNRRIDLILFKNEKALNVVRVRMVGEAQQDRTRSRLWPSDHAGVTAKFIIKSS